jgi:hypothetical protein
VIDRERIYGALWDRARMAASFATAARRLRHWSDVAPAEQPALFMAEKGALTTAAGGPRQPGLPVTYILYADFYLYAHAGDPYTAPAMVLNPLLDALERALGPLPATGVQQLGLPEMVAHAYISGRIETDEGVLGDQAVAVVPVEILCA